MFSENAMQLLIYWNTQLLIWKHFLTNESCKIQLYL